MPTAPIRRLPVWGKALRLAHWSMALAVAILLLTGWLMAWAPERAGQVIDFHYLAAALLMAALAVRLWLLFAGRGSDRIGELLPNRHRLSRARAVLASYLTLGKARLPRWYAHNPLWAPLYLLLFLVLLAQIASGLLLLEQITLVGGISLRGLHVAGWRFLLAFAGLHLLATFFHDAKGSGADLSAMVNGHRLFLIDPGPPAQPETQGQIISLKRPSPIGKAH